MDSSLSLLIIFAVGFIAGFININAGGGSTLTLPTLIFLGLQESVANGTNRIALIIQNISAISSFKRENYAEFGMSMKLSLFTVPGAVIGALISTQLEGGTFRLILSLVMIGIVLTMVFPAKKKKDYGKGLEKITPQAALALIGIGFYGGFIQAGVGFILMASLHFLMRMNLIYVNMHKVFVVLIYTLPAIIIFIYTDNVNWTFGLILAAGNALGAWWAAKFAVRVGEKLIRGVLIAAILIMAVKLLGVV